MEMVTGQKVDLLLTTWLCYHFHVCLSPNCRI